MVTKQYDKIFSRIVKSKQIHESVLFIQNRNGDFSYKNEYGGKSIDAPLLMASITKLFTTTCILILLEQGKLSLDDKVTRFFDNGKLNGLHLYKGQEYTAKLTIAHLLFQTSGLPDVSEEGKNNLRKRVLHEDMNITIDELIALTKKMKPLFAPNTMNRSHYADINFYILGQIIESVANSSLEGVFTSFIFEPLGLEKTYLVIDEDDFIPSIYFKNNALSLPKYIKSCRASGGAITTAREMMVFIKAFFGGDLFNKEIFRELEKYMKLQISFYPIQYGGGYMRIPLGGFTMFFIGKGELIGHSGSTGSFAFYYPEKDLFFVGDVNQSANPATAVRMAIRLAVSSK
ncbi:serine hydrolase domain-containing protein [Sporosarcina thermotolerans]|uniref:Serine hydrolase domain-containing protein n=1 Tax=Sporosarcina thermotolerans TaxID=633404 RepID=A0AAW9AAU3_9BACL|nr:serine hydrolase domain-containing protein [Sporosarcina thermotolerans]MDW0118532.1 serine hydrolase domain-containing protein [Sporosarcina thermotolerans]WHT49522.1 serine hydrolase domain-containing protein [Sporosarcina thermotolerans]